jgi:hypothetical protein
MTLPGPEASHRWQGHTLADRNGEPIGSIETIYQDKASGQPEWALLEAGAAGPAPTFVPLVSASEEGGTVRVPFDRRLVERAPSVPAGRELSEDQEDQLYRHYGVPYSRSESPSGLPAGGPLGAGEPQPAAHPPPTREPDLPGGGPTAATDQTVPASEPPPAGVGAGGGAPSQVAVRAGAPPSEAPVPSGEPVARWPVWITDPRVGAGAAAALAIAATVWRRETISRQISTSISRLGAIPTTFSRRRRRRRRAKAIDRAVSRATERTTALGWGAARVLVGAAVLSVAGAVEGGQRTWAGIQATRHAVRRGGRRLRPSPRATRRKGMAAMVVGWPGRSAGLGPSRERSAARAAAPGPSTRR